MIAEDETNFVAESVSKLAELITHGSDSDVEENAVGSKARRGSKDSKTSEGGDIESQDSYLLNAFLLASASDISVDPIIPDPSTMKSLDEDENIERFLAKTFTLPEGATKEELSMLNTFINEVTDLVQNGGTPEQRQNLVKAAIRDGLPKDIVEEVLMCLVCEPEKVEGKESRASPSSLDDLSEGDDLSEAEEADVPSETEEAYDPSESEVAPEPPLLEPASTTSSLSQQLDRLLSDSCEMNSMDAECVRAASAEEIDVMDTFIDKLAPREGASANEIELLSQFMKLAAPAMSGKSLSQAEETKLRSAAAGVGISEKLLDELLQDKVSSESTLPPASIERNTAVPVIHSSGAASLKEISSAVEVDVETEAVEISFDKGYAEMKEQLIEDIEEEEQEEEWFNDIDKTVVKETSFDKTEESPATQKLAVVTENAISKDVAENNVWSPVEDYRGERYAMPATPLSQMETPRITSANDASFEGLENLISPRSRLPRGRSRYSPSSKALVTPAKLGGSAAAAVISRWAPRRAGRRLLPIKQHWKLSYRERTKEHPGYFDVNVFSLMGMAVPVDAHHHLDDVPWEDREVKQRFLHEQSISFSRNWFGDMPRKRGNDKHREPVARPDSMAMPMSHRQEQDWPKEWYSTWQSRKLFGEENDDSSTSSYSSSSSHYSDGRTGSILSGSVLTRETRGSGYSDSFDDNESDCESTWDYDEDVPECGHIVNVKQKIGERVSRVNPYTTSSLRTSRWRRKYFPRGTFPY